MIRIKLAELLGKHRMHVSDLAEATGIHRNTLHRMYHERNRKVDLDVLDRICVYFHCPLSELMDNDIESSSAK